MKKTNPVSANRICSPIMPYIVLIWALLFINGCQERNNDSPGADIERPIASLEASSMLFRFRLTTADSLIIPLLFTDNRALKSYTARIEAERADVPNPFTAVPGTVSGALTGDSVRVLFKTVIDPTALGRYYLRVTCTDVSGYTSNELIVPFEVYRSPDQDPAYSYCRINPNPNNGSFSVQFNAKEFGNANFSIATFSNRTVLDTTVLHVRGVNFVPLTIPTPSKGLYWLNATIEDRKFRLQIVVE